MGHRVPGSVHPRRSHRAPPPPPNRVDVESVGKTPGPRLGGYALRCEAGYDVHIRG